MSLEVSPELRKAVYDASKKYAGYKYNKNVHGSNDIVDGIGPDGRYRIPKENFDPLDKTKGENLQEAANRLLKEKEIADANKHGVSVGVWREFQNSKRKAA